MALYKEKGVNPAGGCLPMLLQFPVLLAFYSMLSQSIELRGAVFGFWITDLSQPDPYYVIPVLMGVTMFVQMKLNPAPPDPVQQKVFTWMPVFFTYLLASFPAGLVIYWAWNNFLSVLQQSYIMHRQGVDIPLLENLGIKKGSGKDDEDSAESKSKG